MSGATWFLGDPHFGHVKVAEIRGFASPEEHDAHLISQWLSTVQDGDTVWLLGDLTSGRSDAEERALEIVKGLPGSKHLIAGNHDSVSSIHRGAHKKQKAWLEVFDSVQQFARIRSNGVDIMLSHYPYIAQGDGPGRGEARYSQFRLPDIGAPLIHAHTHHTDPFSGSPTVSREMCVSWDARRGFTSQGDVDRWIIEGPQNARR